MKTSDTGIALIKRFESCSLTAYPDKKTGAKPWTIGWGTTGLDVVPGTVWTQAKCDGRFLSDLAEFEAIVDKYVTVPLTQGQYNAMVSIVYNVGPGNHEKSGIVRLKTGQPSTLLTMLNAGHYSEAAMQFLLWDSPGSSVENGLHIRRVAEVLMFNH